MTEIVPATSQPAPTAQTGDGKKSDNVSVGQLAARFAAAENAAPKAENIAAPVVEPAPATPAQEAAPAATETPAQAPVETAAPAEATPEAQPEADDVLSHSTTFTPEQQAIFDKRLGKEVAKTKRLAEELAQAKAKLEAGTVATPPEPSPVQLAPTPEQPLAHITDLGTLQTEYNTTKAVKRLVEGALYTEGVEQNGAVIDGKVFTKPQLQKILLNATIALEDQIPVRANFLQQKAQFDASAYQKFPFLKDKSSPEYQMVQATLRNPAYSWLHNVPQAMEILGVQVLGVKALQAQQEAANKKVPATGTTAPQPKPPASQTAVGAATGAVRQSSDSANIQRLESERKKLSVRGGVTGRDVARYLSQREQLSQTRS